MSVVIGANRGSKFRGTDDHYPTPRGATMALLGAVDLPRDVWEPAAGDGAMAKVLAAAGHNVVATTLIDRGYGETGVDFMECRELRAPAIVTNPPYAIANDFIGHALTLRPAIAAFLLRLKFLEGIERQRILFSRGGLAEVLVFIERVKFYAGDVSKADQPGWNTEAFAWFVWRDDHAGPPTIGWISRDSGGVFA